MANRLKSLRLINRYEVIQWKLAWGNRATAESDCGYFLSLPAAMRHCEAKERRPGTWFEIELHPALLALFEDGSAAVFEIGRGGLGRIDDFFVVFGHLCYWNPYAEKPPLAVRISGPEKEAFFCQMERFRELGIREDTARLRDFRAAEVQPYEVLEEPDGTVLLPECYRSAACGSEHLLEWTCDLLNLSYRRSEYLWYLLGQRLLRYFSD